jgi:hypothetical protein
LNIPSATITLPAHEKLLNVAAKHPETIHGTERGEDR